MSSGPTRTFITRKVTLADGKELRTGQAIRVVHKGYHHLGIVAFIDISGKEGKTIEAAAPPKPEQLNIQNVEAAPTPEQDTRHAN